MSDRESGAGSRGRESESDGRAPDPDGRESASDGRESASDGRAPDPDRRSPEREVLSAAERRKVDEGDDGNFYRQPRMVTHVDDGFVERLRALYAEVLSPGDRVFDAMSSFTSHLPAIDLGEVVGHGMNAEELAANDRLDRWFVRDFNRDPSLPLETGAVDAVLCAVSVQYLQRPAAVFAEFGRVLAPGGVLVVSFSNRLFPTKAVRAWREATMDGRADLVREYVRAAGAFDDPDLVVDRPERDPFYALVARRLA